MCVSACRSVLVGALPMHSRKVLVCRGVNVCEILKQRKSDGETEDLVRTCTSQFKVDEPSSKFEGRHKMRHFLSFKKVPS